MALPSRDLPAIDELAGLDQWVQWQLEERNGKMTKVPYRPGTGLRVKADSTTAVTWGSFDHAIEGARQAPNSVQGGVGFVLRPPYVFIDLDKCRDPETGEIKEWALALVERFRSYTEVSPSGTGLHIIVKGRIPVSGRRVGVNANSGSGIECYCAKRYTTVTGELLDGCVDEIVEDQEALDWFWRTYMEREGDAASDGADGGGGIDSIAPSEAALKLAAAIQNDPQFKRTWNKSRPDFKDQSLSAYDMALAVRARLMEWSEPEIAWLIQKFREGQRSDKGQRPDYVARTVKQAVAWADNGRDERAWQANVEKERKAEEAKAEERSEVAVRREARDDRDKALEAVRDRLLIDVDGLVQVGRDPAIYFLVVSGQEIRLGSEHDLLKQGHVRARLMSEAGIILPTVKALAWDTSLQCLMAIREVRENPEMASKGRVLNILRSYLTSIRPTIVTSETHDRLGDVIFERLPFIVDGRLHLSVNHLKSKFAHSLDPRLENEIRGILGLFGFKSTAVTQRCRSAGGAPVRRSYLVGPAAEVIEPQPEADDDVEAPDAPPF